MTKPIRLNFPLKKLAGAFAIELNVHRKDLTVGVVALIPPNGRFIISESVWLEEKGIHCLTFKRDESTRRARRRPPK